MDVKHPSIQCQFSFLDEVASNPQPRMWKLYALLFLKIFVHFLGFIILQLLLPPRHLFFLLCASDVHHGALRCDTWLLL